MMHVDPNQNENDQIAMDLALENEEMLHVNDGKLV